MLVVITVALTTLGLFIFTYLLSLLLRNQGIVDVVWGLGIASSALIVYRLNPSYLTLVLATLTLAWGVRLAAHIALRNLGKPEDFRYANWRKEWGYWFVIRSFFQVFLLQWLIMQLVVLPLTLSANLTLPWWGWLLGITIWLLGFCFEAIGDYQLSVFLSNKKRKAKLMTTGLWRYTRHPNYFGEATLWWGIGILSYLSSHNILAFLGPLTINFLLLKVSGIPMLEAKYKGRKDWAAYARQTSAFFPLPPSK